MPSDATLPQDERSAAQAASLSAANSGPPSRIPGYNVERLLGEGAYGSVWLASEQNTGKRVAIKFYNHRRGLDWSLLNREVEKLAVLYTCRDIVGLIQVGWNADPPYYVMEYLENGSLGRLLERGPLSVAETERIMTGVTQSLVHAHTSGILHCDVKPANVLLDQDYAPRLADFGQSRLSHEQSPALGTLFFMAPEQADLSAIPDPRWDVYALGALFYQALCGQAPHDTPEAEHQIRTAGTLELRLAAYRQVIQKGPPPRRHWQVPGVDPALAEIIDRCLQSDPSRRFPDARGVLAALHERSRQRSRRPLLLLGIVGILGPALLLLALVPIVMLAMSSAAETAQKNLAARALDSDLVTAKILSYALEDELDQRRRTLINIASEAPIRALAAVPDSNSTPDSGKLAELLSEEKREIDDLRREMNTIPDESWFFCDADGVQRWRDPPSEHTTGHNFAGRDYFHGQGANYDDGQNSRRLQPITAPHLSLPFRSEASEHLIVALTVPVRNLDGSRVVGVLGRTIQLAKLLNVFEQLLKTDSPDDVDRIIALLDVSTGHVLDHHWMSTENMRTLTSAEYEKLMIDPDQREQIAKLDELVRKHEPVRDEDRTLSYRDPLGRVDPQNYGMTWLAAFWPVGKTSWMTVVQERRREALQPVEEIHDSLRYYALLGLVLCVILLAGAGTFIKRSLTETKIL